MCQRFSIVQFVPLNILVGVNLELHLEVSVTHVIASVVTSGSIFVFSVELRVQSE